MGQARSVILALKPKIVSRKNRILGKIQIMENQDSSSAIVEQVPVENPDVQSTDVSVDAPIRHHSVLSDHQLDVDGVIYRELKTLNRVVIQVFLQITNNSFSILAFRPSGLYMYHKCG